MRNGGIEGEVAAREAVIAAERETWSLIQREDLAGFGKHLAEEFFDIFPDGVERSKEELLEFLKGAELKEYQLSNFRVTMLNEAAAVVFYFVDARAFIGGEEIAMRNAVTSGWAQRAGRWINVFAVASARG